MSVVEVEGWEFAVEEGLEEVGGGEGVELLFFAGAGELFAGAFAINELMFGFEGAEALIDEDDGEI